MLELPLPHAVIKIDSASKSAILRCITLYPLKSLLIFVASLRIQSDRQHANTLSGVFRLENSGKKCKE